MPSLFQFQDAEPLEERDRAAWAREEYIDYTVERPGTHWSSELHGYYDTDEEVEELNENDNLMNMMEGNWG